MWDDDQDVRAALLTELADDPPPPGPAGLASVIGKGRRRRRVRQGGIAVGVVALLSATTVTAAALQGDSAPPVTAARPATEVDWPRAGLPARTPYTTWRWVDGGTDVPGRPIFPVPMCEIPQHIKDGTGSRFGDPASADLRDELRRALAAAAPDARIKGLFEWTFAQSDASREFWTYSADVADDGGAGSVSMTVGEFTGAPAEAADFEAFDLGNCTPPKRHVLADGTVVQIYPVHPSGLHQVIRLVRIYRPDGTLYQLSANNWSSADYVSTAGQPDLRVVEEVGRTTPPLTEAQLARLGLDIAE